MPYFFHWTPAIYYLGLKTSIFLAKKNYRCVKPWTSVLFVPAEQLTGSGFIHVKFRGFRISLSFCLSLSLSFLVKQRTQSTFFESNKPEYSHIGFILCSLQKEVSAVMVSIQVARPDRKTMQKRTKHCRGWKRKSNWPTIPRTELIKQELEKPIKHFRVKQEHWELPLGKIWRDSEVLVYWLPLKPKQQSWGPWEKTE